MIIYQPIMRAKKYTSFYLLPKFLLVTRQSIERQTERKRGNFFWSKFEM